MGEMLAMGMLQQVADPDEVIDDEGIYKLCVTSISFHQYDGLYYNWKIVAEAGGKEEKKKKIIKQKKSVVSGDSMNYEGWSPFIFHIKN